MIRQRHNRVVHLSGVEIAPKIECKSLHAAAAWASVEPEHKRCRGRIVTGGEKPGDN